MTRTESVLLLVLLVVVVYALMYAGWRRRSRRHPSAAVATSPVVTSTTGADRAGADRAGTTSSPEELRAEGTYVSTTTVASRLERVAAGGLGVRARATMAVGPDGVRWERQGAAEVHVEPERLTGVGRERGMAGKWVGQNRLVVVTWRADDGSEFATGFLPRITAQTQELVDAVERHLPGGASGSPLDGSTRASSTPDPSTLDSSTSDSSTSDTSTSPRTQPTPDGDQ
jgi:hypothetical protein